MAATERFDDAVKRRERSDFLKETVLDRSLPLELRNDKGSAQRASDGAASRVLKGEVMCTDSRTEARIGRCLSGVERRYHAGRISRSGVADLVSVGLREEDRIDQREQRDERAKRVGFGRRRALHSEHRHEEDVELLHSRQSSFRGRNNRGSTVILSTGSSVT